MRQARKLLSLLPQVSTAASNTGSVSGTTSYAAAVANSGYMIGSSRFQQTTAYDVGSSTNIKWHEGMVDRKTKETTMN